MKFAQPVTASQALESHEHVAVLSTTEAAGCSESAGGINGQDLFEKCLDIWPRSDANTCVLDLKSAMAFPRSSGPLSFATRSGQGFWRKLKAGWRIDSDHICERALMAALEWAETD